MRRCNAIFRAALANAVVPPDMIFAPSAILAVIVFAWLHRSYGARGNKTIHSVPRRSITAAERGGELANWFREFPP